MKKKNQIRKETYFDTFEAQNKLNVYVVKWLKVPVWWYGLIAARNALACNRSDGVKSVHWILR